ncbi:MAG: single-stranded DNA-binding protein [Planctomycetota bacterium]
MASYNRVVLVGNITRDIELRYTPGGMAVADIAIAVNERRKNQSGDWVDEVSFIDITLFGRTAEVASEYLGKGSPILVEGRLKQDRWEQDGQKRSKLKVICDRMQMLGTRAEGAPRGGGSASASSPSQGGQTPDESYGYSEGSAATATAGAGEANPTGSSPSYEEPDIPF